MTREKSALVAHFAPALKQRGFKKRGGSWYRQHEQAVQVVNIQQSQFGPVFFINLGVGHFAFGCNERPPEYECHIRARLDDFDDPIRIHTLLDFQKREFNASDADAVLAVLLEKGLPWLHKCSTESGLEEEASKGRFLLHHSIRGRCGQAQQGIRPDAPASGGSPG